MAEQLGIESPHPKLQISEGINLFESKEEIDELIVPRLVLGGRLIPYLDHALI